MRNIFKFFGRTGLILLGLAGSVPAQSPAPQSPPSEPYVWRDVVIGGGGFVAGIIPHPREKGLMYARTDVGGAYRWDDSAHHWVPITDWMGLANASLTGIESIAVDPNDSQRVYVAAGIYESGNAAILRSDDQGKTFQQTDVPFKMGGNESGRFNGERLAVDPNRGNILFFGSRRDGLWKSADRGATWLKVEGFPDIITTNQTLPAFVSATSNFRQRFGRFGGFSQQPVGIVSVVFDPASGQGGVPTPTLYAAVAATGTNLFCSTDGGFSWLAVSNQPVGLRPNHLVRAPDGMLYLSYGREPGPGSMSDGAVWKYNPKDGVWTDITPVHPSDSDQPFGYGCIAVDAQHPSTLMATTFCHWHPHDEIFRSTNGGASWTQLWPTNTADSTAVWDHSSAPYTVTRTPHWMGTIVINPFDSNQVLFTTGYGIWCCTNATAADQGKPTHWVFLDQGLEETVPLALISPPKGAHLLSGLGDIDGFRHDDFDQSPAKGTFSGQRYGNTESLAFAEKKPNLIVRTGTGGGRGTNHIIHASISRNGGRTWKTLASEPADSFGAGPIALSADGKTIVWTPRGGEPNFTVDQGVHWTVCAGLASDVRVVADPLNSKKFYACDTHTGKVLVSTNGAADFSATPASFPVVEGFGGGFGGGGGAGATLDAVPDFTGDLWLAFRANGLYHSANGGVNFTKVDGVEEADSLGFGKAAPGRNYPALYLAGTVNQLQALFRSDDAGQTWVDRSCHR